MVSHSQSFFFDSLACIAVIFLFPVVFNSQSLFFDLLACIAVFFLFPVVFNSQSLFFDSLACIAVFFLFPVVFNSQSLFFDSLACFALLFLSSVVSLLNLCSPAETRLYMLPLSFPAVSFLPFSITPALPLQSLVLLLCCSKVRFYISLSPFLQYILIIHDGGKKSLLWQFQKISYPRLKIAQTTKSTKCIRKIFHALPGYECTAYTCPVLAVHCQIWSLCLL